MPDNRVTDREALALLVAKTGLTVEEAERALRAFRTPLPARARLHTGLVIRLLPGSVSDSAARGMVKRGWLVPEETSRKD